MRNRVTLSAGFLHHGGVELRHLRYFAAVAEALNFSRAAEKLRVAQPALSRQIRDLEREMDTLLIDRGHGRMHLTDAGRVFYSHIAKLLAQVDIAVTAAQEAARGQAGRLIIGGDWQLVLGPVPACVRAFREEAPLTEVELAELPVLAQLEALRAGVIHLGLVPHEVVGLREDLETTHVLRTPLMVAVAAVHPIAGRSSIRLIDLADEVWTFVDNNSVRGHRVFIVQRCRLAGFTPRFTKAATSLDGMLANVASGGGITLLPESAIPAGHPQIRTLETDCDPMEISAVWRRDDPSRALHRFVEILRAHVR